MKMTEKELVRYIADMTGELMCDIEPLKRAAGADADEVIEQTSVYIIRREYWNYWHKRGSFGKREEVTVYFKVITKTYALPDDEPGKYTGDTEILHYEI